MRAKHEGTIQELPDGKKRGVVMINGRRIFGPRVEKRSQALPALRLKLLKLEGKPIGEVPNLSSCVSCRIQQMASESYSPTTIDMWKAALKAIDASFIGSLSPAELTVDDLKAFGQNLRCAKRTAKNYIDVARQIAKANGNPLTVRMVGAKSERKVRLLTPEEQTELLGSQMSPELRLQIQLALWAGLGRAELAGLMHEDRDGNGIRIARNVVRSTGRLTIKATKTANRAAWVPLPPELLDVIGNGSGFVFGVGHKPISPSVLDDRWRRVVAQNPRWKGIGLHDFRRTFGMNLLEAGVDVKTASELMRHDAVMLLQLYTKSRKDLKEQAMEKLFEGRRNAS